MNTITFYFMFCLVAGFAGAFVYGLFSILYKATHEVNDKYEIQND